MRVRISPQARADLDELWLDSIKPNEIRILRIIHSSQDAWTVFRGE
jgi:plasmid stabilization system protein ParE